MTMMMRLVLTAAVLLGGLALLPARIAGATDALVNRPCSEADFDAALATVQASGGGLITFDCGGPATITFTAQKEITADVRIDGADLVTLSGGDATRHFWVYAGGSLSLERIVLEDGFVADDNGGSIYVEEDGTLNLTGATLRSNRAEFAGAVYLVGGMNGASAAITGSRIVENEAFNGSGGALILAGGSIGSGRGASVTITDSELADNFATDDGGAIVIYGGGFDQATGASLTITGSTLLRNVAGAGSGGAISNDGGAFDDSGGATLTIVASTLTGNSAGFLGGAIFNSGGAFHNSAGGTVEIRRSTLNDNRSFGSGGAIANHGGGSDTSRGATLSLKNSTVSGNEATDYGGGLYVRGGWNAGVTGGSVQILASTITANNSLNDWGDGLYVDDRDAAPQTTLRLSIVAENDTAGGVDCQGTVLSNGRNLDSDNSCGLFRAHDVPGGVADLGPLADNGGPTQTHLPGASSDALDAGPETCMEVDQRELARPGGAACDIGSVEVQPVVVQPVTLCVNRFTREVLAATAAGCNPTGYDQLVIPNAAPQTFCYVPASGELSHVATGACPAGRTPHVIPDDGELLACVSIYTSHLRRVSDHSQCVAGENPFTIPAVS